jgi:hypothetical protein
MSAKTGPGEVIFIKNAAIIKRGEKSMRKKTDPIKSMDLFTTSK